VTVTLKDKNGTNYKKKLTKGCGVSCETQYGQHDIICPSCVKFIWHGSCLSKMMDERGIMYDQLISYPQKSKWSCPQCTPL